MYSDNDLSPRLLDFFESEHIKDEVKFSFFDFLCNQDNDLKAKLNDYFDQANQDAEFTPLFIINQRTQQLVCILADLTNAPDDPGECGSILGYIRASFHGEDILCSDCSGQLSCSSCSIEVLKGKPVNPEMRDEEYDMLSIDPDMAPTPFSRLGCQTIVGKDPLIVLVRAYG